MTTKLGCLFLHGFTSSLDCVRALVPMAERLGLPYRMPLLRGHGTRPEDLRGVTWRDWYADAEKALLDLRGEVDQVVVCGLSMGGLVALHLAAERPQDVAAVAVFAPALEYVDPLTRLSPLIARVIPMFKIDPLRAFSDQQLAARNTNYTRFATDAFVSLYRYRAVIEAVLPRLRAPLLIMHSHRDRVIKPSASQRIYDLAGSTDKQLIWLEQCGHEMLLDCETQTVVAAVEGLVRKTAARLNTPVDTPVA